MMPVSRLVLPFMAAASFMLAAARPADAQSADAAKHSGVTDVWIDVDTANMIGEIDDGLMLIQAFHSPEVSIHGVSVTFGNTTLQYAFPIALNITRSFGPKGLKVYEGALSADDLGKKTDAVEAMAAVLRKQPLTIVATGPVTNVATLIQRYPKLVDRIDRIVMVAARRPGQHFNSVPDQPRPFRDFNFEKDPDAMRVILKTEIPLVFAPWEVASHVWLTPADFAHLRATGGSGAFIYETSQQWLWAWTKQLHARGGNPFDTLAMGWVTHPELIKAMPVRVWIKQMPDDQPGHKDQDKPYLLVKKDTDAKRSVLYCYEPRPQFKRMLLQRLAGPRPGAPGVQGPREQ